MTKLQPNDWIMEYHRVNESGVEEVKARYTIMRDGARVALVPSITFFSNHDLLENLKFWIETAHSKSFDLNSKTASESLIGDLEMLRFILQNLSPSAAECAVLAWTAHKEAEVEKKAASEQRMNKLEALGFGDAVALARKSEKGKTQ